MPVEANSNERFWAKLILCRNLLYKFLYKNSDQIVSEEIQSL